MLKFFIRLVQLSFVSQCVSFILCRNFFQRSRNFKSEIVRTKTQPTKLGETKHKSIK